MDQEYHKLQLEAGWHGAGCAVDDATRSWIEAMVEGAGRPDGTATLKFSQSVEIFRMPGPPALARRESGSVVCKHDKSGGSIFGTRARKNFDRARRLMRADIGTATPLAFLERGRESWLVTEYLPDLVDLDQFALTMLTRSNVREAHRLKSCLSDCVVDLLARLAAGGLHHRDLKASNILISGLGKPGGEFEAVILDLDGLRTWTLSRGAAERSRLVRLAASLLQYRSITRADYVRFLRRYLKATGADEEDWRPLFRSIASGASNYNRRAHARKGDKLDGYAG